MIDGALVVKAGTLDNRSAGRSSPTPPSPSPMSVPEQCRWYRRRRQRHRSGLDARQASTVPAGRIEAAKGVSCQSQGLTNSQGTVLGQTLVLDDISKRRQHRFARRRDHSRHRQRRAHQHPGPDPVGGINFVDMFIATFIRQPIFISILVITAQMTTVER